MYLFGLGFHPTYADTSHFIKHHRNSNTMISLHVDDLIITGNVIAYIAHIISQIHLMFEMNNHGRLHHFLGVQVSKTAKGLFLSQTKCERQWIYSLVLPC